jgi:hypothetical protein
MEKKTAGNIFLRSGGLMALDALNVDARTIPSLKDITFISVITADVRLP